ncbi:SDR family oxidoreductase [Flavobacterium alkalisoli]|uniref:SDR family oxidoreductase n=1 Tax=Flavobacterium alkalisoli TaxID=2602769 RepID=A0A5B9G1S7_9FLAO|nr:SDR family oxidoreductase [Flavobacterium alkalisoli]QEE51017.1 SDR family oxidoreductase [Flavobacterium alkalisoli]
MNKIAVVTGGSRGLGKDMALNLAKKGLDVIVTYHSKEEQALKVVSEIESIGQKAHALQLDTGKAGTFDFFFSELTKVLNTGFATDKFDFLVNNAGIGVTAAFADTSEEDFDSLIDIQFKGPFFLTQKALPHMNDGGGIVNISTGLTRIILPYYPAYSSTKAAMENLTKYLAKDLGVRGIRVNIVAPGAIETDFAGGMVRDNAEMNSHIASHTALGRVGLPTDIGSVVAFLCSEDAKWITAQRIEVSGGQML